MALSSPPGFGARRVEVTEEHTSFHASVVYFRAGQDPIRRHTSVGPGIPLQNAHEDWDQYPHTPISPGASQPPTRSPSRQRRRLSVDDWFHRPQVEHYEEHQNSLPSYSSATMTPPMTSRATSPASSAMTPTTPGSERQRSRSQSGTRV